MSEIELKIKMAPGCDDLVPARAHSDDAAFDLRSRCDMELPVGRSVLVPTGVFLELPPGFEAQVRPRSGLALKEGITVLNSPGTIDADYRGELMVLLVNLSSDNFVVNDGERIAQMVVARHAQVQFVPVTELDSTERGEGGYGHTGVK